MFQKGYPNHACTHYGGLEYICTQKKKIAYLKNEKNSKSDWNYSLPYENCNIHSTCDST
jgi:hypothetical protein